MKTNWTPEQIERMRVLWNAGKTAQEIANTLNGEGMNISRSAVLGKVHRHKRSMNFVKRTAGQGAGRKRKEEPCVKKKKKEAPPLQNNGPARELATLRRSECHWPVDQLGVTHLFCGAPVGEGPYCAHHRYMSLQNPGTPPKSIVPPE